MSPLLLALLFSALSCAYSETLPENVEILMENVLVLRVAYGASGGEYVPLTCGEASWPVFWKKNGVELSPALKGNQVRVLVEEFKGGNYTCHLSPNGEYLNHTVVMVQLDPDNRSVILENSPKEGHIHCSAPNYKGAFHCSWKRTQDRSDATVLLIKAERNLENIPCELDADGSGVHCQDASCPYREDKHQISITVHIYFSARLEAYSKAFFLREIVRPDKLSHLQSSDAKVFSWSYPESWGIPCTYYPLKFHVRVLKSGRSCNSEEKITESFPKETKFEVAVKTRKFVFCVRAQDMFTGGPWSHWSQCTVDKHHVEC